MKSPPLDVAFRQLNRSTISIDRTNYPVASRVRRPYFRTRKHAEVSTELPTASAEPDDEESTQQIFSDYHIDIAGEASLISDAHGRTIWCNNKFTAVTGYAIDDLFGRNCAILQGPESDPTTIAEIARTLSARRSYQSQILNYRRDGTTFWNHLSISPLFDTSGVLVNFLSVQRDVSQNVEREELFHRFQHDPSSP